LKARLSKQLPQGCELLSVTRAEAKTSFYPTAATYVFQLPHAHHVSQDRPKTAAPNELLNDRIKRLLASERLTLGRRVDAKGTIRNVDVRPFLEAIESDDRCVTVRCRIAPAGSIRVDEILKLLQMDADGLAAPVKRTNVRWQRKTTK
jgi:hypothetical protein